METTNQLNHMAGALSKAQGEMTNPPKTRTVKVNTKGGGSYSYSYAELDGIIDHVRPIIAKHNLAIIQRIDTTPEAVTLITELIHESGQSVSSTHPLPKACAAQEFGSYLTYARRYSLCAILGIAAESDNDGSAANGTGTGGAEASTEATLRDEVIERICEDSVSNVDLVRWCRDQGLADDKAKTSEDLPLDVIKQMLIRWPEVLAFVQKLKEKTPSKKEAQKRNNEKTKPPAEKELKESPPPDPPVEKEPETNDDDLSLIPPNLRKLMKRDGVTKAALKHVYVSKGHLPEEVQPEDLPDDYVEQICAPAVWAKVLEVAKQFKG